MIGVKQNSWRVISVAVLSVFLLPLAMTPFAAAQGAEQADAPFSLEVSPSPLVVSLKPGEQRVVDLQIRNTGTASELLKVGLREFTVSEQGNVELKDTTPKEVESWVSFGSPQFTVQPGELYTEKLNFRLPAETAFTYTFAITITRAVQPVPQPGKQAVKGTVAVLSVLSFDKPGASRSFEVVEFKSAKRMYEYLPTEFTVKIKNTGNVAVQPAGNVFVQRKSSGDPISALQLNARSSYVLPGSSRELSLKWEDGFPMYVDKKSADNGPSSRQLLWDWGKAQDFRFGKYNAKLVAFYNDGQRDIPVYAEVSFWVVPWKMLLAVFVLMIILAVGIYVIVRKLLKLRRFGRRSHFSERD